MNSQYSSPYSSQASSRAQTPVIFTPKQTFMYTARKFVNKIPPIIKYGLPGLVIGAITPNIYNSVKKTLSVESGAHKLSSENESKTEKLKTPSPKPKETPIPRSTYNPAHPRTGYRYHYPCE